MRLCCAGLFALLVVGRLAPGVELAGTTAVRDRAIADAVVWLDAPGAPLPSVRHNVVLDQRNLSFSPRVLAVRVGTTVEFPNNDRVFHDVF
jgi:plastocyanin